MRRVALPCEALEGGRLRVDAERHARRLQLFRYELVDFLCGLYINYGCSYHLFMKPIVMQWHKCVTVNAPGCGFDPQSGKRNIYLNLYFHFFALAATPSAALSTANPYAMPSKFSEKWDQSILTPGSPYIPCHVRYIAYTYTKSLHKLQACINVKCHQKTIPFVYKFLLESGTNIYACIYKLLHL